MFWMLNDEIEKKGEQGDAKPFKDGIWIKSKLLIMVGIPRF